MFGPKDYSSKPQNRGRQKRDGSGTEGRFFPTSKLMSTSGRHPGSNDPLLRNRFGLVSFVDAVVQAQTDLRRRRLPDSDLALFFFGMLYIEQIKRINLCVILQEDKSSSNFTTDAEAKDLMRPMPFFSRDEWVLTDSTMGAVWEDQQGPHGRVKSLEVAPPSFLVYLKCQSSSGDVFSIAQLGVKSLSKVELQNFYVDVDHTNLTEICKSTNWPMGNLLLGHATTPESGIMIRDSEKLTPGILSKNIE